MKKYLYCDSCFLIKFFQEGKINLLSQYKDQFFISKIQLEKELIKPDNLAEVVRQNISVIEDDRDEIRIKTNEFFSLYSALSIFDCLAMAYSILDGYCLVSDDKALIKKCRIHNIETKSSKDIEIEFLNINEKT